MEFQQCGVGKMFMGNQSHVALCFFLMTWLVPRDFSTRVENSNASVADQGDMCEVGWVQGKSHYDHGSGQSSSVKKETLGKAAPLL